MSRRFATVAAALLLAALSAGTAPAERAVVDGQQAKLVARTVLPGATTKPVAEVR